jgi:hypothetical protein
MPEMLAYAMPETLTLLQTLAVVAAGLLLGPALARFAEIQVAVLDHREAAGLGGSELAESLRRFARPGPPPERVWTLAHQAAVALALGGGLWLGGPGGPGAFLALACALTAFGGLLDLRAFWLPDSITGTLLWLALGGAALGVALVPAGDSILGAGAAWGLFTALQLLGRVVLGQPALGGGDVKLVTACGALSGLSGLPAFLILVALATVLLAVTWRFGRQARANWMPLGAAIAAAGILHGALRGLGVL